MGEAIKEVSEFPAWGQGPIFHSLSLTWLQLAKRDTGVRVVAWAVMKSAPRTARAFHQNLTCSHTMACQVRHPRDSHICQHSRSQPHTSQACRLPPPAHTGALHTFPPPFSASTRTGIPPWLTCAMYSTHTHAVHMCFTPRTHAHVNSIISGITSKVRGGEATACLKPSPFVPREPSHRLPTPTPSHPPTSVPSGIFRVWPSRQEGSPFRSQSRGRVT